MNVTSVATIGDIELIMMLSISEFLFWKHERDCHIEPERAAVVNNLCPITSDRVSHCGQSKQYQNDDAKKRGSVSRDIEVTTFVE